MARKSYTSKARQAWEFEIDGNEFVAARRIPGASFVDFVRQIRDFQDGGNTDFGAVAGLGDNIFELFESAMEPEEFSRFWKWARSPDGCDFETLIEVMADMVSDTSDRPTQPPARSQRGRRSTGAKSTDD